MKFGRDVPSHQFMTGRQQ